MLAKVPKEIEEKLVSWLQRWVTLNHYSVRRKGWYEHIVMQHFFRLKYLYNIIIYVNVLFTDIYNYDIKRFNIIKLHYFEIFHVKVMHFWQKYSREGFYYVHRPQKYRQRTRSKVGWTRLWTQATSKTSKLAKHSDHQRTSIQAISEKYSNHQRAVFKLQGNWI